MGNNNSLAVRVWLGYRHEKYADKRESFISKLNEIFIPVTWQWMHPLGCTAYLPTLLADTQLRAPDEIALVFYTSQKQYTTAMKSTTTGRGYGALHGLEFSFSDEGASKRSWSKFPLSLPAAFKTLDLDQPYALNADFADWHNAEAHVYCGIRSSQTDAATWQTQLTAWVSQLCEQFSALNAYFVMTDGYYCLWYLKDKPDFYIAPFDSSISETVLNSTSTIVEVEDAFSLKDNAITIEAGQTLSLTSPSLSKDI